MMLNEFSQSLIPFHKVAFFEEELFFIKEVLESRSTKGDGVFTNKCHEFFKKRYDFKNVFLTTSCSTALEMAALLLELKEGDEIIVPTYNYITSASSFALHGATLIFVDSLSESPHMNPQLVRTAITARTKAIIPMHYGGCSVGFEEIMSIAKEHDLIVIEDAAHGIDSYYNDKPLGGIGHMGVLSFHQSKNVSSGHGGLLIVNDVTFLKRAELVWNKGSNKSNFDNGEVDFYSWKTLGSSFFPSEIVAASLYGQLLHLEVVTSVRVKQWNHYYMSLRDILDSNILPLTEIGKGNGHIFYLKLSDSLECTRFISFLLSRDIVVVPHYRCLHRSSYFGSSELLQHAERWVDCLVRLPLYHDLSVDEQDYIIAAVKEFFV